MSSIRFILLSLVLLVGVVPTSMAHTFSTSFINLKSQADGLQIRWQLTFHDLLALNQTWMPEDRISGEMLNQNLDKLQLFAQKTLTIQAHSEPCELTLDTNTPWSTMTFAREQYIVLEMTSDCPRDKLSKLAVNGIWQELPDHKIIVENTTLDQHTPHITP